MKRGATAVWKGNLKMGRGTLTTDSQALLKSPYSFGARFESQNGTNPEELVAAAHAGCFTMALTAEMEKLGIAADSIETKANVTLEKQQDSWRVTGVHLSVTAQLPAAGEEQFNKAAETAKQNCPISKLLRAPITLEKKITNSVITPLQETD